MRFISDDKIVGSNTVCELKKFNSQSLTTQVKKGEQLVSMMPAIKNVFDLMGHDMVELSTENEPLKIQIISYDRKWLEESKAKLLKQLKDQKRANLIMSRMEKQMKKKTKLKCI